MTTVEPPTDVKLNMVLKFRFFFCEECESSFPTATSLKRHSRIHSAGGESSVCAICGRSFANYVALRRHLQTHVVESEDVKPSVSLPRRSGDTDERDGTDEESTDATLSLSSSPRESPEKLVENGGEETDFFCSECRRTFSSIFHLEKHSCVSNEEVGSAASFRCAVCRRAFSNSGNLKRHGRTHSGEKPHICSVCDRRFSLAQNLERHKRAHNGVKPFVCDVCQSSFVSSTNLKRHLRTHTGEKPFRCNICHESFVYYERYKRHCRVHLDEVG